MICVINFVVVLYDRHYSANACLTPICSLHGLAITTVEALGSTKTKLHQIQVHTSGSYDFIVAHMCTGFGGRADKKIRPK